LNIVGRSFARDAFTRALSADAFVRAMLDFERALALAEGDIGVVPQDAARVIAKICTDLTLSAEALAVEGKRSGSLAVPLRSRFQRSHSSGSGAVLVASCGVSVPSRTTCLSDPTSVASPLAGTSVACPPRRVENVVRLSSTSTR